MVCCRDEHICEHLQQPLATYDYYYHSKNILNRLCTAVGVYSRGFRLVTAWSFIIRSDGVSMSRDFKKEKLSLISTTGCVPCRRTFGAMIKSRHKGVAEPLRHI